MIKLIIKMLKHRILPEIVILGGDPTGTGKGGVSIYGECFDDEIHDDLKHTGSLIPKIFKILKNH